MNGRAIPALRPAHVLAAVFILSFGLVWWLAGDRLILINDEGAFLSHAARIAGGEVLYKDLFGLTGPASFWLLALSFKIFGVSLAAAHLILAFQIAILTTLVFFVTRELADASSAGIGAFIFLALNTASPAMMTNNHRWDADTYAIAGVVAIWRGHLFLGGVLLALSFWATPILAITAVTTVAAALLVGRSPWRIVAGGAIGAAAGLLALILTDSLAPFIENLLWMRNNYSEANRMSYGQVIGGYPALFGGTSDALGFGLRIVIVAGTTLPAWLPLLCGILLFVKRDRNLLYFFVCGASMIAAVSPRFDIGHLIFAVPLFFPVAASFIPRGRWMMLPAGAVGCLFLLGGVMQRGNTQLLDTPVGRVRARPDDAETVRWLMANIHPGERLFVYPYVPIAYFVTRAQNVSRFSGLYPGLFTVNDERLATEDMIRKPPAKVLYMDVRKEQFLRITPAIDPKRLQLHYVHNFVENNFQRVAHFKTFHLYTPKLPP